MKKMFLLIFTVLGGGYFAFLFSSSQYGKKMEPDQSNLTLVLVFDGLRSDYITPELMPNLYNFGKRGVIAQRHHSVYPTVTSVNSASIATGTTPGSHGILHNTMYIPEVSNQSFSPGNQEMLQKIHDKTGHDLLTAKSLGEAMETEGKQFWVTGSSGRGTLMRLNHKLTGFGVAGARGFIEPESMKEVVLNIMDEFKPSDSEQKYFHRWAFDAYLKVGLDELQPDATVMWISDPDNATHQTGVGSPQTLEAVQNLDELFGRFLDGIEERGLKDQINIFVTTDHGFSTLTRELDPVAYIATSGIDSTKYHVVTDRPKVYVKDSNLEIIRKIVAKLQQNDTVGAIFTRPEETGSPYGIIKGTLSLASVNYNHKRSPDILFDAAWNNQKNNFGFAGYSTQTRYPANHGTSSPYDIGIHLIAAGPDIKQGVKSQVPTGNIDLAPTVCYLLGIEPPSTMEGRILYELLRSGPNPESIAVKELSINAESELKDPDFRYKTEIRKLLVDQTEYLHFSKTQRVYENVKNN